MAQLSVPWLQEVEKGEAGDAVAPIILGSQKNISYVFFLSLYNIETMKVYDRRAAVNISFPF